MTTKQRLYRSQTNKVIAGVCGGLSEYLNVDATVVRLVWILITLFGGAGIFAYIAAWLIIPTAPAKPNEMLQPKQSDFTAARIFGILFIGAGVVILLDNLDILSFHHWWNVSWEFVFPGLLIMAGVYFLTKKNKNDDPSSSNEQNSGDNKTTNEDDMKTNKSQSKTEVKQFRRSLTDKKIFGICGGAGEYFGIDPTIVRVVYALFTVLSAGTGILFYLLMFLIIPEEKPQIAAK
jgi:phage shock protein C